MGGCCAPVTLAFCVGLKAPVCKSSGWVIAVICLTIVANQAID